MNKDIASFCEDRSNARITYCGEYGKKECPMTCFYANKTKEELRIYHIKKMLGKPFNNNLNFDVRRVGE